MERIERRKKAGRGLAYGLISVLLALLLLIPLMPTQVEAATAKPKATVSKKTLYVGYNNYQIRIKNLSASAKVTYTTSDKTVAKVTSKGVIKPVAKGTATITVKIVQSKKTYTSKIAVTVKNPYVAVHHKKTSLVQSSDYQLTAKAYGLANAKLKYSSSNVLVAKVDANGMLHARGVGKAKITVRDTTSGLSTSYTVKVYEKTPDNFGMVYMDTSGMDKEYIYIAPELTEDMTDEEKAYIEYMTDIQNRITKGRSITMQEMTDYYEEKNINAKGKE